MTLSRQLAAEGLGSAFLLAVVVGSGIMAERLAGGNMALALLANAIATGTGLYALILGLAPASGGHFNPLVTLAAAWLERWPMQRALLYMATQLAGALAGVAIAHAMFGLPTFSVAQQVRSGAGQWYSEFVATFGLLAVILASSRNRPAATPAALACYITAAYWFTASTSFANPAVTLARSLSDSFAGIRPADAPAFILAQLAGAACATALCRWLYSVTPATSNPPARPHDVHP